MKIAQIISTPPIAWATGGCARVVYDLSRELANRGHEVTIITTDLYKPRQRYLPDLEVSGHEKITILRFPYFSDWLAWKKKIYISFGLIKYIRQHILEYDIVHLQDLISVTAIFTSLYCRHHSKPYVLTTHGSIPWLYRKNVLNKLYAQLIGKKILANASKILVLNQTELELCKSIGIPASRLHLISNGINLWDYGNLPEKGKFRTKYRIHQDTKIVLYVGRLYDSKGLDLLIKAFHDILMTYTNLILVLVGPDDGYKNKLFEMSEKFQISNNLLFCGYISNDEKMEAFVDADVFVTPLFFGFPIAFIEACFCGKSIVTTNKGDELDWIDGQVGYSTNYDENSINKAIIDILSNETLRKRFEDNGKIIVRSRFTWEVIAKDVETIYKSIETPGETNELF
jgi:glycosyltransferase involved in cell wall biosynthesis